RLPYACFLCASSAQSVPIRKAAGKEPACIHATACGKWCKAVTPGRIHMAHHPPSYADILASKTAVAMPHAAPLASTELRHYFQAIDNMLKVFAIHSDDEVVFLTDPLLDRRVVDAISGIAASRGARVREFMAPTTQLTDCPEEAKALVESATF